MFFKIRQPIYFLLVFIGNLFNFTNKVKKVKIVLGGIRMSNEEYSKMIAEIETLPSGGITYKKINGV